MCIRDSYSAGAGRDANPWWREARADAGVPMDTPQQRAEADLPGPFVTQEERVRYAASEARPNVRYHYRQIAADYAMKAVSYTHLDVYKRQALIHVLDRAVADHPMDRLADLVLVTPQKALPVNGALVAPVKTAIDQ